MVAVFFAPLLALVPVPLELASTLAHASALPALAPLLPSALPSTLLAGAGSTVNAPPWVLPVAAACTGLIPLALLVPGAIADGEAKARADAEAKAAGSAVLLSPSRRLRRERLLGRLSLAVLPSEGKGHGLFARSRLSKNSYVCDYEGELLDLVEYHARYPEGGVSDYAIGIKLRNGQMRFIDGIDPIKSGLARFINHSRKRPNVKRRTVLDAPDGTPRVLMYTDRQVSPFLFRPVSPFFPLVSTHTSVDTYECQRIRVACSPHAHVFSAHTREPVRASLGLPGRSRRARSSSGITARGTPIRIPG